MKVLGFIWRFIFCGFGFRLCSDDSYCSCKLILLLQIPTSVDLAWKLGAELGVWGHGVEDLGLQDTFCKVHELWLYRDVWAWLKV